MLRLEKGTRVENPIGMLIQLTGNKTRNFDLLKDEDKVWNHTVRKRKSEDLEQQSWRKMTGPRKASTFDRHYNVLLSRMATSMVEV